MGRAPPWLRISDISDEQNTVCVDWNSATLDAVPASAIDYCERKGLAWNQMYLAVDVEALREICAP
jgi:hypothetical protein